MKDDEGICNYKCNELGNEVSESAHKSKQISQKLSLVLEEVEPETPILRPLELREAHILELELEPLVLDDSASESDFNFQQYPQQDQQDESTLDQIDQTLSNQASQSNTKVRLIKDFLELQLGLSQNPRML